ALRDALKDSHTSVRIESANALCALATVKRAWGRPLLDARMVLAALTELLGDGDVGARSAALKALALVGPESGVAPPAALVAVLD
ncbi:hypothetical protein, partial [Escherichia coli]|uniref:hypothetical protein n=1 Tax=Escherichia coli TaxID=562 RepID=UPI003F47F0E7